MAMLNFPVSGVDAAPIEERVDFSDLMPKGNYSIVAVDAEIKRNQKDTANYLRVSFQVIAGPWRGKFIGRAFMIWLPDHLKGKSAADFDSPTLRAELQKFLEMQDKAEKLLAQFCRKIGIPGMLEDTSQLLHRPAVAYVGVNKGGKRVDRDGQATVYPDKNDIYGFRTEEPDVSQWKAPAPKGPSAFDDIDVPF